MKTVECRSWCLLSSAAAQSNQKNKAPAHWEPTKRERVTILAAIAEIILAAFGGGGISAIIIALLNRHWAKQDKKDDKLSALVIAQKVLMIDRVRHLGQSYINDGGVSLQDKENLLEMHAAYKALGGNGHLDTVMAEVENIPIIRR